MELIIFLIAIAVIAIFTVMIFKSPGRKEIRKLTPASYPVKEILKDKVTFYQNLSEPQRKRFEKDVYRFLNTTRVTGVDTEINEVDEILVAASAVIPVFGFEEWEYSNLDQVLLYSGLYNEKFETTGKDRTISGMVGWGYLNGTMILSKPSLHLGFSNKTSKENVGIHEFIHLIDKKDGAVDGVPDVILQNPEVIPWLKMMKDKLDEMRSSKTDINPYGATNEAEFYSVVGEYFFKRPQLLRKKHPELYRALTKVFKQNPAQMKRT